MPLGGLALANSLATALEATTLFVIMRRRLNGIGGFSYSKGIFYCCHHKSGEWAWSYSSGYASSGEIMFGWSVWVEFYLGGLAYGLGLIILRVPEVRTCLGYLQARFRKVEQK